MTLNPADLLLYCGALVILFLTPGPVLLALIARGLSGGFHAAWPLAFGVAVGDIIWPLIAVLGIAWILSVFDSFMLILRWVACGVFSNYGLRIDPPCRGIDFNQLKVNASRNVVRFSGGCGYDFGQPKGGFVLHGRASRVL